MRFGQQVTISDREGEVLAAVARHRSNAQIAHELHISIRTVESHVASLLRKFGVADRRALADLAAPTPGGARRRSGQIAGVPVNRDSFIGRGELGEQAVAALRHAALVTLHGPGGIGKSRLAAAVTQSAALRFAGGGAFVDLVAVGPGFVTAAVAAAIEVRERPRGTLGEAVARALGDSRALLVLDNCDHLIDEVADLVARLLRECSELTVLTTSRERLAVAGEHAIAVPPLPLASDAAGLFTDRARAADPGFAAGAADVADLCARLDGIPLAIELAAARVGSLGVDGLREALTDTARTLSGGRGTDPRHRSLRSIVGWSYDLLSGEERDLFRRLSVFAGSFDLDAVAAVNIGQTRAALADLVGRLTDRSLVAYRPADGPGRWRMLETIRAIAAEQLTATGDAGKVRRSHLEWAADTAASLWRATESAGPDEFDQVADDLRAALGTTVPEPDPVAHRLARCLAGLTFARGGFAESGLHYQAAATRADLPTDACQDLANAADTALCRSDGPTAYRLLMDAAQLAQAAGDATSLAANLAHAGRVAAWVGRGDLLAADGLPAGATVALPDERTAELPREETRPGYLTALFAVARAWDHGTGNAAPDRELAEVAVAAARRTGDQLLSASALDALGSSLAHAGRLRDAHRVATERLQLAGGLSRRQPRAFVEIVDAFHAASVAAIRAGELPDALAIARRAEVEDPIGALPIIIGFKESFALALTGRFDEAVGTGERLWQECSGSPPMEWLSPAVLAVALVHGVRGSGEAGVWRSRALEVAGVAVAEQSRQLAACAAFLDARLAVHAGDVGSAAYLVERCFAEFAQPRYAAYARAAGAELAAVAGLPDAAERLSLAGSAAAENAWAAACLARARGRLGNDLDALGEAVLAWERIDARFERACTLMLIPGREPEGSAELNELGCPYPALPGASR